MIQYLGYVAGVITVGSFLPQVIRTWQTRRTGDLSLGMFALLVTASSLWMVYGAMTGDWPVILTNAGMVALNGALAGSEAALSIAANGRSDERETGINDEGSFE